MRSEYYENMYKLGDIVKLPYDENLFYFAGFIGDGYEVNIIRVVDNKSFVYRIQHIRKLIEGEL